MLDIIDAMEAELATGATLIERPLDDRPLRAWVDLAERLRLRVRVRGDRLVFEKLGEVLRTAGDYSADSPFAQISKLEDPRFVLDFREALERVAHRAHELHVARDASLPESSHVTHVGADKRIPTSDAPLPQSSHVTKQRAATSDVSPPESSHATEPRATTSDVSPPESSRVTRVASATQHGLDAQRRPAMRVLDLGCHTGDELVLVERYLAEASIVAVDRDASALAVARSRFPAVQFVEADVLDLPDLGHFDLVVAIGLLQSGALDDRELLRRVTQRHLEPYGAVILGIPNCRYIDSEIEFGARMKNFTQPELGLVIKDIAFYRKYLQQHHRQVFVSGKHYLFVTAVPA